MRDYRPIMSFDDDAAKSYRDITRGDETDAVAFLEQLADHGPVLELAIGTGRIALPLSARGLRVDGIDISPAMVKQLQTKQEGKNIHITIGDFADVSVDNEYQLIYIVWNSFFNLLTQEEQIRCFSNVSRHLSNKGLFVVEAYVPSFLYRLRNDQYVDVEAIQIDQIQIDVLRHDISTQIIEESHVSLLSTGIHFNPVVQRYAWPAELDLMARIAGLCLKQRWGGWKKELYNSTSGIHVSVYGK
jgi:SAM-dependent methyltransferase